MEYCSTTQDAIETCFTAKTQIGKEVVKIKEMNYLNKEECRSCEWKGREDVGNIAKDILTVLGDLKTGIIGHQEAWMEDKPRIQDIVIPVFFELDDCSAPTKTCELGTKIINTLLKVKRDLKKRLAEMEYHLDSGEGCVHSRREHPAEDVIDHFKEISGMLQEISKGMSEHQISCHHRTQSAVDSGIDMEGPQVPDSSSDVTQRQEKRTGGLFCQETGYDDLEVVKHRTSPKRTHNPNTETHA